MDEMRRTIREDEPAKPSTCLSTMQAMDLTTVAKRRQAEPPKLIHLIRGDLDWIVMKCLEKDRTRRYETANGLAADIQRHLNNEPVTARPPSRWYEFQKTVRRHKFGFAAAAALILVLVLGVLASTWQAMRATRAEREQSRLRGQAEANEEKAKSEAAKAAAISDFLQQLLSSANPHSLKRADTPSANFWTISLRVLEINSNANLQSRQPFAPLSAKPTAVSALPTKRWLIMSRR